MKLASRTLGRVAQPETYTRAAPAPTPLSFSRLSRISCLPEAGTLVMKRTREEADAGPAVEPGASHAAASAPGHAPKVASTSFTAPSAALTIDASAYDAQLHAKLAKLSALFADMQMPEVEVHTSPPQHYRMRAEFNVWGTREGERPRYIMFATAGAAPGGDGAGAAGAGEAEEGPQQAEAGTSGDAVAAEETAADAAEPAGTIAADAPSTAADTGAVASTSAATAIPTAAGAKSKGKGGGGRGAKGKPPRKPAPERVEMTSFPVGSHLMNELMPLVLEACSANKVLKERLFQVNYHTTLNGECVVVLLYHKKLDDAWTTAARALRPVLAAGAPSAHGHVPHIVGRSRKQKVLLDQDFVVEKLEVAGKQYMYRQYEGSFSQPNARVCEKMLEWAVDVTRGSGDHDLLELYCGNGNFTLPLAANFRRVVATEISKPGVEAARWNIEANGLTGRVFVGRLSSEEFVATWRERGTRRRLDGLWDWSELDMRTLFVDPPRSGLDADTVKLMAEFDRVVYISCNPETLHANLRGVAGVSHDVVRFAAFDQFPFTHHLECGVYLVRKPAAAAAAEAAAAAPA